MEDLRSLARQHPDMTLREVIELHVQRKVCLDLNQKEEAELELKTAKEQVMESLNGLNWQKVEDAYQKGLASLFCE